MINCLNFSLIYEETKVKIESEPFSPIYDEKLQLHNHHV